MDRILGQFHLVQYKYITSPFIVHTINNFIIKSNKITVDITEYNVDYPTSNTCTAVHGSNGQSTTGNKVCCNTTSVDYFQCVLRYSEPSTGTNPSSASVSCGAGYTMIQCSGWGEGSDLNAAYIGTDEACHATSVQYTVYAIAMWCVYISFLFPL